MDRRISILRLRDGRPVVHNPIPLDDDSLARVAGWGKSGCHYAW